MPRIIPEPRYFSMPSIEVGAEVRMKRALNCWPWVWSLTHSPDAVIHSPAEIVAAWPMTVTRLRWPRAFARRTQKPFSLLWKVTRSTKPASTSWVDGSCCGLICVATVGASPPNRIWRPALRSNGGFGCYLLLGHNWANPQATAKSFELIARHVMPHFQGQAQSTQTPLSN